jgi:hypothetical protein
MKGGAVKEERSPEKEAMLGIDVIQLFVRIVGHRWW